MAHRESQGSETAIMVDTCHDTFVKPQNVQHRERPLMSTMDFSDQKYWLINCSKRTTLMQEVVIGETGQVGMLQRSIRELLVLSTQFFYKPKTLLKNKVF